MIYCAHHDSGGPARSCNVWEMVLQTHAPFTSDMPETDPSYSQTKVKDRKVITYHKQVLNLKPFHQVDIKFRKYNRIKKVTYKARNDLCSSKILL